MAPAEHYNGCGTRARVAATGVTPVVIYVREALPVMVSKQISRLIFCRHDL
jgi:hypothetical protein